jgi:hypothetical protein
MANASIPDGWYLEGLIGSTHLSNKSYPGSSSSSGVGGNLNLGYKFMPFFATEIGYTQYANTTVQDQFGTKAATDKHSTYDITAKGIVPIATSGFELFAKLGIQRSTSNISTNDPTAAANLGISNTKHSDTNLYLGAGAQYYFMSELAGVVQWARAQNNSNTGTLDLYSVGISFIFS